ncbi:MAG TPA: hypothetical protein PKU96_05290 [bacterium]|jgi:hypothetical protein|nr:hypothetical protein [Myxococcales bacterium]OQA60220.1 MAG: hypothetical protein BWY40_01029 [bacterium ADurb.Bin270]HPW45765.1 hypothetical protein [bacterium]HQC50228.1 hypothetical protein [bacterium]HQG12819.1 hypothetical protein [bacterium]
MEAFRIEPKGGKTDKVILELVLISAKLGLSEAELFELIDSAVILGGSGKRCDGWSSVFNIAQPAGELLLYCDEDEDIVPNEYICITKGMNLFFSID